jgi:hypothetical protein
MKKLFILALLALLPSALLNAQNYHQTVLNEVKIADLVTTTRSGNRAEEIGNLSTKKYLLVVVGAKGDAVGRKMLPKVANFYYENKGKGDLAALFVSQDASPAAMAAYIKGLPLTFAGVHSSKVPKLAAKLKGLRGSITAGVVLFDGNDNVLANSTVGGAYAGWEPVVGKYPGGVSSASRNATASSSSRGTSARASAPASGGAAYPLDLRADKGLTVESVFIVEKANAYEIQKLLGAARDKLSSRNSKFGTLESAVYAATKQAERDAAKSKNQSQQQQRPATTGTPRKSRLEIAQESYDKAAELFDGAKDKAIAAATEKGKALAAPWTLNEKPAAGTFILYTWTRPLTARTGYKPVEEQGITYEALSSRTMRGTSGTTLRWRDFSSAKK